MKYENIWNAVDNLAKKHGLSPSGLAKLAGLDATTFNRSKRIRPDGKKRWPSLDSINRLLEIFNISFEQFYALSSNDEEKESGTIPFIRFSEFSQDSFSADNSLSTQNWNKILFPDFKEKLYAVEIDSNQFLPLFKNGAIIIAAENSDIRNSDAVIIFLKVGKPLLKRFVRRTSSKLIVTDFCNPTEEEQLNISDVNMINRIVWMGL